METSVQIVEISILRYIPEILAWGFGIVLAVLMIRRGGVKAEKLLLAGCSLLFVTRITFPLMVYPSIADTIGWLNWWLSIPIVILQLAGFVCLTWAFWLRWRKETSA